MAENTVLINERTQGVIADAVEIATTRAERRRGLLGRDRLEPSAALMLTPCKAVHTAFMRFSIDVLFVDRKGHAVKIVRNLVPWRIAAAGKAHAVIELAAGSLPEVSIGDRVFLSPRYGETPRRAHHA